MANYVGALDQGTTSNRFIIFDRNGQIVAVDQKEHEQEREHHDIARRGELNGEEKGIGYGKTGQNS